LVDTFIKKLQGFEKESVSQGQAQTENPRICVEKRVVLLLIKNPRFQLNDPGSHRKCTDRFTGSVGIDNICILGMSLNTEKNRPENQSVKGSFPGLISMGNCHIVYILGHLYAIYNAGIVILI
jgi:hypothetical protein